MANLNQSFMQISITKNRTAVILLAFLILGSASYIFKQPTGYNFQINPLGKIRQFFQNRNATTTLETIRVVSEESQVIDVVKNASPAVVSIVASAEVPKLEQCYQENSIDGFPSELFSFKVPALCQKGTQVVRVGAGSGFIVSPDGYILTNKHVVENVDAEYTVVLNDRNNLGKKIKAQVIARHPSNDIAVLKIDMNGLPYLNFGDSNKLKVGQTAVAIGYALGQFDNTVSKGVVSGLLRSIDAVGGSQGVEHLRGLIQTDAAINPGNSGGPLLDIEGNVIGMNVAVAEAQSIGFAIPINTAKDAFDQVRKTGMIAAALVPFIGVRYAIVTPELKSTKNLPYDYGMLIVVGENGEPAIVAASPADKAGLKEGDLILEADGRQLNDRYLLLDFVLEKKIGDETELKIYKDGELKNIKIKLEERRD